MARTPGPWRIEDAEDAYGYFTISRANGAEYSTEQVATVYELEDANLIVALPLLLAVVEQVAAHFAYTDAPLGVAARAALARINDLTSPSLRNSG
ncbi:hypothetical protein LCGC14_0391670 [marine sediment metagenome]|uniref:Uncharacterized protein n=1 Tax=marine sediment metagenome TaxID=412755 RepID=A0A0F9VLL3_9ZZZZ